MSILIYNAQIVTPTKVIQNGSILIEEDRIIAIEEGLIQSSVQPTECIDVHGSYVLPGLVDSHSDAIEMELEPRPSSAFPMEVSFYELEKKLVGEGITTIYHSLSLLDEDAKKWVRQNRTVLNTIKEIHGLAQGEFLIRHKIHLRYEITNVTALEDVKELLRNGHIHQLSFMDHTPGQGQFRDIEIHRKLLMEHRHFSETEANEIIEAHRTQQKLDPKLIQDLADLALEHGIPVASHDDDTVEKLEVVKDWHAVICEFPIELAVAKKAKEMGLSVVMGAPNVMLGKSHSNNLSAMEAIHENVVDILCSDYYPSSLLHAAFKLYSTGLPLQQAVNLVSLHPAKALHIEGHVGSLEIGKKADLLIVRTDAHRPILQSVYVNGKVVCQLNYQIPARVPIT
ncbi:alpha-D-ribose 1-methylphosphonate 5-triphosphate diphosphatase [Bacillus horti]|uniref:Alpha-D-ribose 1-methylphosphonate 5-triphosphate diphosphatase n=1 Tax=Caldalkalibacillus horti TaxID=77523 RepID=A0ABT9W1C8_9BACI|nr:alpha-D-ribose 1-methylphosphonate 5-triphosphate diphosphatase [Bacillus horti]MDQ0167043.1 alpha-D-ribose 1-methylphosphonate 5-triphosphate diphosphatase [Bacillus horti]